MVTLDAIMTICPFFHQCSQILSDSLKAPTITMTGPPPAATNKDQSAILPRSSVTVTTSSAASTPVDNLTQSQINAENHSCITCNDMLQIRRKAGGLNVPNDEPYHC